MNRHPSCKAMCIALTDGPGTACVGMCSLRASELGDDAPAVDESKHKRPMLSAVVAQQVAVHAAQQGMYEAAAGKQERALGVVIRESEKLKPVDPADMSPGALVRLGAFDGIERTWRQLPPIVPADLSELDQILYLNAYALSVTTVLSVIATERSRR